MSDLDIPRLTREAENGNGCEVLHSVQGMSHLEVRRAFIEMSKESTKNGPDKKLSALEIWHDNPFATTIGLAHESLSKKGDAKNWIVSMKFDKSGKRLTSSDCKDSNQKR